MAQRDVSGELMEGVTAMNERREGKLTLRSYKIDPAPLPKVDSKLIRDTRKKLRCSRAVFARKLRINERTLENGNRAEPNPTRKPPPWYSWSANTPIRSNALIK